MSEHRCGARIAPLQRDLACVVALGEHTHQRAAVHHHQRANLVVGQKLQRLENAGVGTHVPQRALRASAAVQTLVSCALPPSSPGCGLAYTNGRRLQGWLSPGPRARRGHANMRVCPQLRNPARPNAAHHTRHRRQDRADPGAPRSGWPWPASSPWAAALCSTNNSASGSSSPATAPGGAARVLPTACRTSGCRIARPPAAMRSSCTACGCRSHAPTRRCCCTCTARAGTCAAARRACAACTNWALPCWASTTAASAAAAPACLPRQWPAKTPAPPGPGWRRKTPGAPRFVFGHSLGGAIAVQLAATVDDEAGLIVENSFPSIPDVVRTFKWGWLPVGRADHAEAGRRRAHRRRGCAGAGGAWQ